MDAIINYKIVSKDRKEYQKPAILQELFLETKAGSVIPPTRAVQEPSPFISPGDFTINSEP